MNYLPEAIETVIEPSGNMPNAPVWLQAVTIKEKDVRPEQQVKPIRDPAKEGLLFYMVSYQGHPCPTLLDCRATHSFFAKEWLRDRGIPTRRTPKPIGIGLFDGSYSPSDYRNMPDISCSGWYPGCPMDVPGV